MVGLAVHHLAFRTNDLPRLEAFYRDVVGLAPCEGGSAGRSVWFALGDGILMLERADDDEAPIAQGSKELLALRVSPEAMRRVRARLDEAGVALEDATRFTIYFRDPDGRRLAFSHHPHPPVP